MKPKPFSALNHFTAPCAICLISLLLDGAARVANAGSSEPAPRRFRETVVTLARRTSTRACTIDRGGRYTKRAPCNRGQCDGGYSGVAPATGAQAPGTTFWALLQE